jgi:hypothetical protein
MAFRVDYITGPFTIIENYAPSKDNTPGVYIKTAVPPIGFVGSSAGALIELPTVVVDVLKELPGQTTKAVPGYQAMTLYSCTAPLHATAVKELIFATREPTVDPAVLKAMQGTANKQGIFWKDSELKPVEHGSKCK